MSAIDASTTSGLTGVAWGQRRLVAVALAAAALCAAYALPLVGFFQTLWAREHYQHFPFVLAAFAWLAFERLRAAEPRPSGSRSKLAGGAAVACGLAAWALLAAAYAAPSPWLAYLSLIVLVAGVFAAVQASHVAPGLWGAWAILLVILPPPLNRDQTLITVLQRYSSRTSSFVLDALGVDHIMAGNALLLPDKQFFVNEACSGIISVASIIACAVIYGVWRRRSAVHTILLAVAGVGWATLMNTLRISTIAVVHWSWSLDWTIGAPHQAISLFVFLFAFLALISTDVLLAGLLAPIGPAWVGHHGEPLHWGRFLAAAWDKLQGVSSAPDVLDDDEAGDAATVRQSVRAATPPAWRRALLAAGLAAFVALPAWRLVGGGPAGNLAPGSMSAAAQACVDRALACDAESLPENLAGAKRSDFSAHERSSDDLLGKYSRTYEYVDAQGQTFIVSCDFPYEGGWHELTVCYRGAGWALDDRRVLADGEAAPHHPWERMEAAFSKPEGAYAFLTVCGFDETATPLPLPTMSLREDLWQALTQREVARQGVAFQVQVWIVAGGEISDDQRATARKLLLAARDRFRAQIAATGDEPSPERSAAEAAAP